MATPQQPTDLLVVNMALGAMGEDRISNLQTDVEKRAVIMRDHYQTVKETALTRTSWRFATKKLALSLLSGVPPNRWSAVWQLPPDTLKVLFVYPPTRYEIQGKRIFANVSNGLVVDYIRYIEEGDWPPWFVSYVVFKLLEATVKGITGDDMSTTQERALDKAEINALAADAQQQPNQEDLPSPFIDVRA